MLDYMKIVEAVQEQSIRGMTAVADDPNPNQDAQYFQLDNWDELASKYSDDEIWKYDLSMTIIRPRYNPNNKKY